MSQRNRVLVHPDRVRQLVGQMRRELDEMAARHAAKVSALRAELQEVRSAFDELRSVSLACSKAEVEVAELRRLREIGRARAAERDPGMRLQ